MKLPKMILSVCIGLVAVHSAAAAPAPMPLISTNCPAYASSYYSGDGPNMANDTSCNTSWRSSTEPVSTSQPAWLAYDLSAQHPGNIVLTWRNSSPGYNHALSGGSAYNNVGTYEIDCNAAAGGSLPTSGWVTVVPTISNNTYHSRTHFINMTGYNWIRLYATASDGATQNVDISINMDVYNASQGNTDTWMFLGDSITDGAFDEVDTSFTALVNQSNSSYTPDWEDGGMGGWLSNTADPYISTWMSVFPGQYVTLNFGTNDAWNNVHASDFTNDMTILANAVISAGKVPIIPHIPYSSSTANIQTDGPLLNAAIDQMIASNPKILAGPDFWTFFLNNQSLLSSDGVHPSSPAGYEAYRQQWANWAVANIYGSQSGPPSAPTNLMATSGNAQIALGWAGSGGATSYSVFRGTTSGGESGSAIATGITSTSYTNTGLTNGTTYYYKVDAVNSSGTSGYSNEASAVPAVQSPPPAPTGLTAAAGNGQVVLNWTASTGATSYNVYQGTSAGGESGTPVATGIPSTTDNATGLTNGTKYYFTVKAVNTAGTSGASNEASATPQASAPPPPSGLSSSPLNASVSIWWSPDMGATSYNLYRGTSSGGENSTAVATGITAASTTDAGLTNGATYYYEIKAVNTSGTSGYSNETSCSPIPPPPAPTGLTAAPGSGQVSLSWGASSTATSYNVLRSTISGSGYASVGMGISTTSYTNTGLTNGTTYYFVVTAVNASGTSGNSNQASATPSGSGDSAPYNFESGLQNWFYSALPMSGLITSTAEAFAGSYSMAVSFNGAAGSAYAGINNPSLEPAAGNVMSCHVWVPSGSQVTAVKPFIWDLNNTVTSNNVAIGSLTTNAWNTITLTVPSNVALPLQQIGVWFTTGATWAGTCYVDSISWSGAGPPAAPTGLTATPGSAQAVLSWTASSGATSYNVLRSTTSGSGYAQVVNVGTTAYTNTGLTNGTTYYFVVDAVNGSGTSANSSQASATPQSGVPAAPTGLTATPGNTQVALTWTASTGATSYNVLRSTVSGSGYASVTTHVTTTNYTNTGLTNGTTYYFVVAATNASGTSANSAQASATPSASSDPAQYNFESGTQNWFYSAAPISALVQSTIQVYAGTYSLAASFSGAAGSAYAGINNPNPEPGANAAMSFHVWVPSGSQVTAVKPFIWDKNNTVTSNNVAIGSLTTNAWNTITLTVPSNVALPLQQIGVWFTTGATWSGTCYIDSIGW